MYRRHPILIVEDSDEDFYTTERILKTFVVSPIERCTSGAQVMPHLQRKEDPGIGTPPREPSLILLDLNLPGKRDGRSVLSELKTDKRYRRIPVVIMTTSRNPWDVRLCFDNGAAGYIVKPVNLDKFTESMKSLVTYWFETVTIPARVEGIV